MASSLLLPPPPRLCLDAAFRPCPLASLVGLDLTVTQRATWRSAAVGLKRRSQCGQATRLWSTGGGSDRGPVGVGGPARALRSIERKASESWRQRPLVGGVGLWRRERGRVREGEEEGRAETGFVRNSMLGV